MLCRGSLLVKKMHEHCGSIDSPAFTQLTLLPVGASSWTHWQDITIVAGSCYNAGSAQGVAPPPPLHP
jgi:hypothetical protein